MRPFQSVCRLCENRKKIVLVLSTIFLFILVAMVTLRHIPYNLAVSAWQNPEIHNIMVNRTEADELYNKVRILCIVPTTIANEATKVLAVNSTWGSHCNKILFVFVDHVSPFPHLNFHIPNGRAHLTAKTMMALEYVSREYGHQYDWVLKADDDAYIIMENLRFLLLKFNPKEPAYLGFHFKVHLRSGYMSGGGAYVLSKAAVSMVKRKERGGVCANDGNDEDVDVGLCMEMLGVKCYSTRDKFNRDSFHPQSISQHMVGPMPAYMSYYPTDRIRLGPECCSQFSVSFHYVPPQMMYIVEMLLYRISVYGQTQLDPRQLGDMFKMGVAMPTTKEVLISSMLRGRPRPLPKKHITSYS